MAGWTTFLRNHADGIVAMDLFVVPAISFRLLYGLLILRHDRRRIFGRIASRIRPDLIFGRHRFKVPNLSYSQKVRRAELFERPRNGQIIDPQGATCDRGRPTAVVYPNFVETDFFEYP